MGLVMPVIDSAFCDHSRLFSQVVDGLMRLDQVSEYLDRKVPLQ